LPSDSGETVKTRFSLESIRCRQIAADNELAECPRPQTPPVLTGTASGFWVTVFENDVNCLTIAEELKVSDRSERFSQGRDSVGSQGERLGHRGSQLIALGIPHYSKSTIAPVFGQGRPRRVLPSIQKKRPARTCWPAGLLIKNLRVYVNWIKEACMRPTQPV
jgi:hypothetical protein